MNATLFDLFDPPLSRDQCEALQGIVGEILEGTGRKPAYVWSRFNRHFKVGGYRQLPQSRHEEAVDYLLSMAIVPDIQGLSGDYRIHVEKGRITSMEAV